MKTTILFIISSFLTILFAYSDHSKLKFAEDLSNTYIINTDHLEKWDDHLHYSSKGQIDLGTKFGEKIIELLKN